MKPVRTVALLIMALLPSASLWAQHEHQGAQHEHQAEVKQRGAEAMGYILGPEGRRLQVGKPLVTWMLSKRIGSSTWILSTIQRIAGFQ